MTPKIEPYIHECVKIISGEEYNEPDVIVSSSDIHFDATCHQCGKPLTGDLRAVIAHIYEQLS